MEDFMQRWIVWFGVGVVIMLLLGTAVPNSGMYNLMGVLGVIWVAVNIVAVPVLIWKVAIRFISREWHSQAPQNKQ
jgi:hypothetical protein